MKINTYAVNCNDAWLNTKGDDITGSYVKYKDHQEVVSALEAKCAALAAELRAAKLRQNVNSDMPKCSEPATDNTNQQFESLSRGDK